MRTRDHAERPIVRTTIVDMDAYGYEILKNLNRWLDKELAFLLGPSAQRRVFNRHLDWN